MAGWAEKLFYTLSAVVLGSAFFVLQPSTNPEVVLFQNEVKKEFATATIQTIGDQPFESVELVVSSINEFYIRSAEAMITLLTPPSSTNDMIWIASEVYDKFALAYSSMLASQPQVLGITSEDKVAPDNFMTEEPLLNIIPSEDAVLSAVPSRSVLGKAITRDTAANDNGHPWVNLRDNTTGQIYCVAIFNSEVNRYLGPCKYDYH